MKEFIAAFIATIRAAIAKLPTAESIEANGEVAWALRELVSMGIRIEMQFPALKGVSEMSAVEAEVGKAFDTLLADTGKKAVANAETAGEVIPKATHVLLLATAQSTAEAEALTKFQKTTADNAEAATHRAALVTAGLPAAAAEKIPTALLVGDNAEATKTKITGRVGKLTGLGLVAADNAEVFGGWAEGLDAEGDARFAATLSLAEKVQASVKASAKPVVDEAETLKVKGNPAEVPPAAPVKPRRLV